MAEELYVGARVDLNPVDTGFTEMRVRAQRNLTELQTKLTETATNTIFQQISSATAAGMDPAVIKVYDEALNESIATQIALKAQVAAAKTAFDELTPSVNNASAAMMQGRYAAQLLGRDIGVPIPRALSSIASRSATLGPILQAAFPIVAAAALLEILEKIPGAIEKGIDKLRGWDAEAKKTWERDIEMAYKLRDAMEGANNKIAEAQATAGKEGFAKLRAEFKVNHDQLVQAQHDFDYFTIQLNTNKAIVKDTTFSWRALAGSLNMYTAAAYASRLALGPEHDKALKEQVQAEGEVSRALEEQVHIREKLALLKGPESRTEASKEALELEKAKAEAAHKTVEGQLEAAHKVAVEEIASKESALKREKELGQISAEEELGALTKLSAQKIREDEAYYAAKSALDKQYFDAKKRLILEEAAQGKPAAPALATLGGEEAEAARRNNEAQVSDTIKTQDAINNAIAKADAERINKSRTLALSMIEDSEKVKESQIKLAEDTARLAYEAHAISAVKERDLLINQENEKYKAELEASKARLEIYAKDANKYEVQIASENAKQEELINTHAAALDRIRQDADRKYLADLQRETDLVKKAADDQLKAQLDVLNRRLIKTKDTFSQEIADVEDWRTKTLAAMNAQLAAIESIYGKESEQYRAAKQKEIEIAQEATRKIEDIEKQAAANVDKYWEQTTNNFFNGFNQVIQHQKTFSQAMRESWNSLVMDIIKDIEKFVQKWIEEHVIMAAIKKIFNTQQTTQDSAFETKRVAQHQIANTTILAQDTAMNVAQTAQATAVQAQLTATEVTGLGARQVAVSTANVAAATSDAFLAAAAAFESVMQALPFPANVAVAPGVAAATLAVGEGFAAGASFEHGGVVKANLHEGEMVLPSHLSRAVQQMALNGGSNGGGGGGHSFHISTPITINHPMNEDDINAHADKITRVVKQRLNAFNI